MRAASHRGARGRWRLGPWGLVLAAAIGIGCSGTPAAPVRARPVVPEKVEPPAQPHLRVGTCREWQPSPADAPGSTSAVGGGAVAGDSGRSGAPSPRAPIHRRPVRVPIVRAGGHRVRGALDPVVIQRVVRSRMPVIRACYEHALRLDPTLAGTAVIGFTIDASGKVSRVLVTGIDHTVAACLEQAIRTMRFPAPAGGGVVEVRYPFRFQPGGAAGPGDRPEAASRPTRFADRERPPCGDAVRVTPLADDADALATCFDSILAVDPGAVARATLVVAIDSRGAVTEASVLGLPDRELGACLETRVRGLRFRGFGGRAAGRRLACTLVLDNPAHSALVGDGLVLDISHSMLRLGARPVADTFEVEQESGDRFLLDELFRQLATSAPGPLVITAHPTIPVRVVERAVRTAEAAGFRTLRYARGVGTTDSWMSVDPLATPDWGCQRPVAAITVTARPEAIEVIAGGQTVTLAALASDLDFAGYRALFDRLADNPTLAGRRDVAVAASPELPYRVLLNLIEGAVQAGFFDTYQIPFPSDS